MGIGRDDRDDVTSSTEKHHTIGEERTVIGSDAPATDGHTTGHDDAHVTDRTDRPAVGAHDRVVEDQVVEREHAAPTHAGAAHVAAPAALAAGRGEAKRRFGGLDVPASLAGMLVALAMVTILTALISAILGGFAFADDFGNSIDEAAYGTLVAGLVGLFIAYLIGGWAAGRMARYNGATNGLMTAVWTILLSILLAGLGYAIGEEYNLFQNLDLPNFAFDTNITDEEATTAAIIASVIGIAVMLVGGALGGMWGTRFHRRADRVVEGDLTRDRV